MKKFKDLRPVEEIEGKSPSFISGCITIFIPLSREWISGDKDFEKPAVDVIKESFEKEIENSEALEVVSNSENADFVLEGSIYHFKRVSIYEGSPLDQNQYHYKYRVEIAIEVKLKDKAKNEIVWTKTATGSNLEGGIEVTFTNLAKESGKALQEPIGTCVESLINFLSSYKR